MKDMLTSLVGAVAPTIGTALGGPMGNAAMSMLADKLGVPNNKGAVEKAVQQASPQQLAEIKKAELDFEKQMKELEVDVFKLETQDLQDARKTFSSDWTSKLLGVVVIGGFMGYIFLVTIQPPEQNSEALINLVLGYLGGLASAVISFYFGASHKKDE